MKPKVLVDPHGYALPEDLACLGQVVEVVEPTEHLSEQAFIESLAGCEGVIRLGGRLPELTRAVFAGAPDLRIVGVSGDRFGTGIDLAAAGECGVLAVDTDNIASAAPVAEWDLALMLLCLRNGAGVYRQMMAGAEQWAQAGNDDFVHGELTGKKVGLVGCGHVGQRLVELLGPFRVDLRVADPYLPEALAAELGIVRGSLDEVLQHADILVVQVPHTPKTEKMIGAREFDLLGPRPLIAGLDVFDPEPLPKDSRLRHLPNAFVSPHVAWYAPETFGRYFSIMVDEFVRFFSGEGLRFELTQRMVDIRHGRV